MDAVDKQQERDTLYQDSLIENARAAVPKGIDPTGFCLNPYCGEPLSLLSANQRFCNVACRDAFDKYQSQTVQRR